MNVRGVKILRDLLVNKSRTFLVIFVIAIGVAAFGLMFSGQIVLQENLKSAYDATKPAHTVLIIQPFDNALVDKVRALGYVEAVEARQIVEMRMRTGADKWITLNLVIASAIDKFALNKLPSAQQPELGAILLEQSLKNISNVGETVTVQLLNGDEYTLDVAGFVNDLSLLPSEISLIGLGYVSQETAKTLDLPDSYNRLYVAFKDVHNQTDIEVNLTKLIAEIEEQGFIVFNAPIPPPGEYVLAGNMNSVLFILQSLGVLTLILSALLVTSVMSAVITQQIPQIGILKSLGARFSQTMILYFQQVFLFGLAALVLAIPFGLIGSYFLADGVASGMNFRVSNFYLPASTLIFQAASALLVPLLASALPIINGARITIREAISSYNPGTASRVGWFSKLFGDLPQLVNISIRNTFRRKGRLALTFAALILAGAMFIAVLGIRESMRAALVEIQGNLNYDVGMNFERPYAASELRETALSVDGVLAVETWMLADGRLVFDENHLSGSIALVAVPEDSKMARPGVISGRWLSPRDEHGIFVSTEFMELSPHLHVGSLVRLRIGNVEQDWTIVGTAGRNFVPIAYVHADELSALMNLSDFSNRLVAQTKQSDPAYQARVQADLLSAYKKADAGVTSSDITTELKTTSAAQMDILIVLLLSMVILVAVVGGLGLAITMGLNVLERTREIGILRSLGAQSGVVRRVVIVEGLMIGLISWALALPLSVPIAVGIGEPLGVALLAYPLKYIFSTSGMLIWLAVVIVISIIASVIPAQNAAQLTIRDTLVYE